MKAIVDWCSVTFAFTDVQQVLRGMHLVLGQPVSGRELPHGGNGFTHAVQIRAFVELELVNVCKLLWGGEAQRGRAMIEIPGSACGMIDWPCMRSFVASLPEGRLTRVDLAVDLIEGEYTVDDAAEWHRERRFVTQGRNPDTCCHGDWIHSVHGRTLEIGKRTNGKMLRVYEKGKQLGDLDSDWTRFEVQFGSRDRVLPFEMLTDPTKYFVGAYPALQLIVDAASERIKTTSLQGFIVIERALTSIKRCYGKWLHLVADAVPVADLVEALRVREVPKRYQASAVAAGVIASTHHLAFEKWSSANARSSG